jgi:ubiquinone/menaquinone biosynthesis C-methylase UbiE
MKEKELKEFFKATFNSVADGYDNPAMRFFPESAEHLINLLEIKGDEDVLDVATGTGCAGLKIAENLPNGHVVGIDFSQGMLKQAQKKLAKRKIKNISLREMDMQDLDFPNNHFNIAVCAFSIFFIENMEKHLSHVVEKIKPGGQILYTTFHDNAFSPLVTKFFALLESYGIQPPTMAWKRVATQEQCTALFERAGLKDVRVELKQCGYYLNNSSEWWYIVLNGGFRGLVNQLPESDLEMFRIEHLREIEILMSDKGIWLDMGILFTHGLKK